MESRKSSNDLRISSVAGINEPLVGHLLSHYDDTCVDIKEQVTSRDRWFLFVLALVGVSFFRVVDLEQSSTVLLSLTKSTLGVDILADAPAIGAVLWFLLLAVVIRYFQVNVYLDRRYEYLHGIEKKINEAAGSEIVTREGKSYLRNYPLFSSWTHFLYTWVFPLCLLVVVAVRVSKEWPGISGLSAAHIASRQVQLLQQLTDRQGVSWPGDACRRRRAERFALDLPRVEQAHHQATEHPDHQLQADQQAQPAVYFFQPGRSDSAPRCRITRSTTTSAAVAKRIPVMSSN